MRVGFSFRFAVIVTWVVSLSLNSSGIAAETPLAIKAVTPEVQTAEWAVRWWMPRHEQKLADLEHQETVDLLFIGDSITHGFENAGKRIWEERYAPRNAFNIGFSGDRTENVLWRLQHGAVKGISPKLAVVMIGTNNTGHRQDSPEETAAGIRAIVDELGKQLPDTKLLLLAIFPRDATPHGKLRKINAEINELIAKISDGERVFFLNINEDFLTDTGVLEKSIMPDLLHPNEKGYEIWAKAMEPTIERLMSASSAKPNAGQQLAVSDQLTTRLQQDYLLYLPENYDDGRNYPLMLFLHGAGERGDGSADAMELVKVHGPPKLIAAGRHFPFIVASPQCKTDSWWNAVELSILVDHLESNLNVDKDRIYVTGLSMGGFGTWALAMHQPERFAAIAPICGGGNALAARYMKPITSAVWAFHGAKDSVVPLSASKGMVDVLKQQKHANVQLTVYPNAEHDSWSETYDNDELYTWLLRHKLGT